MSGSSVNLDEPEPEQSDKRGALLQGFGAAFLNPKLAIFFFALFSQFVDSDASLATQTLMVTTVGVIDASWYVLIAVILGRPGVLERLRGARVKIDRLFGVILIAVAVRVVIPF